MGLLSFVKKSDGSTVPDFSNIDSNEKAIELCKKNILVPLYLMPLRFGGQSIAQNTLYVPPFVVELKDRYDDMVEDLLKGGKVSKYICVPDYKGKSFIPSALTISASGESLFEETIQIW